MKKCFFKKMAYVLSILGWVVAIPMFVLTIAYGSANSTMAIKCGIVTAISAAIACATATPACDGREEILDYYGVNSIKDLIFNWLNGHKLFRSLIDYSFIVTLSFSIVTGVVTTLVISSIALKLYPLSELWEMFAIVITLTFMGSLIIMLVCLLLKYHRKN